MCPRLAGCRQRIVSTTAVDRLKLTNSFNYEMRNSKSHLGVIKKSIRIMGELPMQKTNA